MTDPRFQLICTTACTPPLILGDEVSLLWTQLPDESWEYCNKGISAWAYKMSKYGVVIASRFDFESENDLRTDISDDILRFTVPGDLVADPFCGSSNVGEIALSLDRKYVGTDVSPLAIQASQRRLSAYS